MKFEEAVAIVGFDVVQKKHLILYQKEGGMGKAPKGQKEALEFLKQAGWKCVIPLKGEFMHMEKER